MTNTLNSGALIKTIEEYRRAYWEHRDLKQTIEERYSPIVGGGMTGDKYSVWLSDNWLHTKHKGYFTTEQVKVDHTVFTANTLQMALEELLNWTRMEFIDDKRFEQI